MDFFKYNFREVLLLVNNIINRQYKQDNWLSVLNSLSDIFNADGAFIGFWDKGFIELKYSSSIIQSYSVEKSSKIEKVNLKDRKIFKETLVKHGYIKIDDYDDYEYALDEWKDIGLKSLLAVTVKTPKKIYGSLHIVKLKEKMNFKEEHIESLKLIANAIASEIEKDVLSRKLEQERDINAQYVKLINSIASDSESEQQLNEWILNTLTKIKTITDASTVNFIMPSENIYARLNSMFSTADYESFKENPLYDLWENNTINTVEFTKDSDLNKCGRESTIEKAVAIPVTSNYKTIAVLCLGFSQAEHELQKQTILFAKTILRYFTSMIYTYKNISRISSKLSETETGLIKAFVSSMEAKDVYTKGHSQHVAIYAQNMGKALGLGNTEQEALYNAGLLHDIGKIGIPDNILLKPGKLTPHEYEIVKLHPVFSYEIIKNIPKFKKISDCIRHHHERCDGSGYPDGLKNGKIELGAKILAIADILDALTTQRPYRDKLSFDEAIDILKHEQIDLDILSKTENVLKESYFIQNAIASSFVPSRLDAARKDMIKRDYMTGLYRRDALAEIIGKYIDNREEFTLFLIDIKNISYINFKYGVDIGDKIIVFVADELGKIQNIDALARTGADVFMFIYRGVNPEDFKHNISKSLKDGIIERVKQKSCVIDKNEANRIIGCYITYTQYPKEAESAEELIYRCLIKKKELYRQ